VAGVEALVEVVEGDVVAAEQRGRLARVGGAPQRPDLGDVETSASVAWPSRRALGGASRSPRCAVTSPAGSRCRRRWQATARSRRRPSARSRTRVPARRAQGDPAAVPSGSVQRPGSALPGPGDEAVAGGQRGLRPGEGETQPSSARRCAACYGMGGRGWTLCHTGAVAMPGNRRRRVATSGLRAELRAGRCSRLGATTKGRRRA
jgi:hypothetical protein